MSKTIHPNVIDKSKAEAANTSIDWQAIDSFIALALKEDIGSGDITSQATIPPEKTIHGQLVLKEAAVIAGMPIFERVFQHVDQSVKIDLQISDGMDIKVTPATLALVSGNAQSILAAERTALNLLQRLCGIASQTKYFADLAKPLGISILDTRKTTPCLRLLEKYAVKTGGGCNHRSSLADQILIKDNHIAAAGSVAAAVGKAKLKHPQLAIEVEVNSIEQIEAAISAGATIIMLDNMHPSTIKEAIQLINRRARIEVSGGINKQNISNYLIPGVDCISIGALTHSVKSIDISLEIEE